MENQFINKQILDEYINKVAQRIDWLVTTCSNQYSSPSARETARDHLNKEVTEVLNEVLNVGFVAGKKEADYNHDQKYRINKFKLENRLRAELKKEVLQLVMKEYGIKDEKIKKKLIKKVNENETDVEENN